MLNLDATVDCSSCAEGFQVVSIATSIGFTFEKKVHTIGKKIELGFPTNIIFCELGIFFKLRKGKI